MTVKEQLVGILADFEFSFAIAHVVLSHMPYSIPCCRFDIWPGYSHVILPVQRLVAELDEEQTLAAVELQVLLWAIREVNGLIDRIRKRSWLGVSVKPYLVLRDGLQSVVVRPFRELCVKAVQHSAELQERLRDHFARLPDSDDPIVDAILLILVRNKDLLTAANLDKVAQLTDGRMNFFTHTMGKTYDLSVGFRGRVLPWLSQEAFDDFVDGLLRSQRQEPIALGVSPSRQ